MAIPLGAPQLRSMAAVASAATCLHYSKAAPANRVSSPPGREAGRWMRVSSEGRPVEAEQLASRIRFNTEFAQKLADEMRPGTTVIVTDQQVVRNPVPDSTYFAAN